MLHPRLWRKSQVLWLTTKKKILKSFRLRVVPHFSSGIVERAKRERARKSPHARKGDTRVGWFSRLASSTIPEEKWGTTRSLKSLVNSAYLLRSAFVVFTRVRSLSHKFTYHMKGIWFGRRLHTCSLSENIHSNKKYAHFRFRIQNPRTREQTRTILFRINASVFKRQVPKISRRTKNKILFTKTYPLGT